MSTWKPTDYARALARHAIRQVRKQPCPLDCPHPDHMPDPWPVQLTNGEDNHAR